jgi:hypothetical protein
VEKTSECGRLGRLLQARDFSTTVLFDPGGSNQRARPGEIGERGSPILRMNRPSFRAIPFQGPQTA